MRIERRRGPLLAYIDFVSIYMTIYFHIGAKFPIEGTRVKQGAGVTERFRTGCSATACMLLPLKTHVGKLLLESQFFVGVSLLFRDGKLRR